MLRARRRFAALSVGCTLLAAAALVTGSQAAEHPVPPSEAVPPPANPATVPGYGRDPVSLLGPTRLTATQMAAYAKSVGQPRASVPIDQLAAIYVQESAALGVRGDIAWAQSIIETGDFYFPGRGQDHPNQNNFGGIGACDSCHTGHSYPSARMGVRAQMQLLRGYADKNPLKGAMIHPPRSYMGIAPTWREMGHGRWATSPIYASSVLRVYASMLRYSHVDITFVPPPLTGASIARLTAPNVPYSPPVREGDGLFLASPNGQVFDVGDARFWGSAYGLQHHGRLVAIATTPHAGGYWLFFEDGRVLPFGSAPSLGNATPGIVAVAPVADGVGYWTVDVDGDVHAYGAAAHVHPAAGAIPADAQIVDIAATRTGRGYWLVDSLGHVYTVGDAKFFGNTPHIHPDDPVVAIAATPWDDGYWTATASGRVFGFGRAKSSGGLVDEFTEKVDPTKYTTAHARHQLGIHEAAHHLVVGLRPAPSGHGYWLITADGLVVGRGAAPDFAPTQTAGMPVLTATSRIDSAPPLRSLSKHA
jgi:hypothetical protein